MHRSRKNSLFLLPLMPLLFVWGAAAVQAQEEQQEEEATEAQIAEAQARVDESAWTVSVKPLSGSKDSLDIQQDTLIFKGGKIQSQALQAYEYPATGYTVSVNNAGKPIWETMQTSESHGVAFWRGELKEDGMRGMVSIQPLAGDAVNYSFSGEAAEMPQDVEMNVPPKTEHAPVPPPAQTVEPAEVEAAPAEAEAPAVDDAVSEKPEEPEEPEAAPKEKKKKGWWF